MSSERNDTTTPERKEQETARTVDPKIAGGNQGDLSESDLDTISGGGQAPKRPPTK